MKRIAMLLALVPLTTASVSLAFFEEGLDHPTKLGYRKCMTKGDLGAAAQNGCNPWNDTDANYSYKGTGDIKKSSLHYNMTAALAVAAGFDRCAAYIIGVWDEATDVGTSYDQALWIPFPSGVTETSCKGLLNEEGITAVNGVSQRGGYVNPDWTYRSFGNTQENEVQRESWTFHWNKTIGSLNDGTRTACTTAMSDPVPTPPNFDFTTMYDLRRWVYGEDTLHACTYRDGSKGPIKRYDANADGVDPGSLAALGVFLHSFQDTYSHAACTATTHAFGLAAKDPCSFSTGHYAGEFGTLPDGKVGSGQISVKTPASTYTIMLHSDKTVETITATYAQLKAFLAEHPEYSRGVQACPDTTIQALGTQFASITNYVRSGSAASGAKRRSDFADSLFKSDTCSATLRP